MNIGIHRVESIELSEIKTLTTERNQDFSQRTIRIKTQDGSDIFIIVFSEDIEKLEVKA